jgi:vacuolar iron transporter family protein
MGVGGYLSTKAERDNYRYLLHQTRQLVESSCTRALEQEIFKILSPYGLSAIDSKRIVDSLEAADRTAFDTVEHGRDKGLTTFLLRFGEGVEHISTMRLYMSALTIGFSYFIGGLIPMVWEVWEKY